MSIGLKKNLKAQLNEQDILRAPNNQVVEVLNILTNFTKPPDLKRTVPLFGYDRVIYMTKSVLESFETQSKDLLIINIGGGSIQSIFVKDGDIKPHSLPVGIYNLNEKSSAEHPVNSSRYKDRKEHLVKVIGSGIDKSSYKPNLINKATASICY